MTGDSITEGDGNASAYRYQLFEKLYKSGAAFEFLGPNTSGDLRLPKAYYHHGGYCGITIGTDPEKDPGLNAKLVKLPGYAEAVRDCDIMLLWIGYNDYGRKIDLEHITDRLTDLIGKYHALNSDLIIYVGTLFNYREERDINKWILDERTGIALEEKFPGLSYNAVDMNVGANRLTKSDNDFPEDDGHPAESGNKKIAASWHDAIIGRVLELSKSKPADAPTPVRVSSINGSIRPMSLRQGESVTFTASVKPDDAEVTTILWSSSNPTVAKVDDYGRVTARIPGEAVITAKSLDLGYTLSAKITVYGGMLDLMRGYTTVFESDFTDKSKWDGPEDVISADYNKLGIRWNRTKTGEMTAKSDIGIAVDNDFVMSFVFRTIGKKSRNTWGSAERCQGLSIVGD